MERVCDAKKRIIITGAAGRMGRSVIKGLQPRDDIHIVGAIGRENHIGDNITSLLGLEGEPLIIEDSLERTIQKTHPHIVIDFTSREEAPEIIEQALYHHLSIISGTTGILESELSSIKELVDRLHGQLLLAPNFSIGAVLMIDLATLASPFFDDVEIIELHHHQKKDAPSGTARRTRELLSPLFQEKKSPSLKRRGEIQEIKIHSIRLPGLLAHQEILFGGCGETLTIRHDSYHHSSFLPGILLAIERIYTIKGMVVGLENLLDLSPKE